MERWTGGAPARPRDWEEGEAGDLLPCWRSGQREAGVMSSMAQEPRGGGGPWRAAPIEDKSRRTSSKSSSSGMDELQSKTNRGGGAQGRWRASSSPTVVHGGEEHRPSLSPSSCVGRRVVGSARGGAPRRRAPRRRAAGKERGPSISTPPSRAPAAPSPAAGGGEARGSSTPAGGGRAASRTRR
ncbi:unnamed protein product [Urochloa humidicola]